ncbi:hypothetical protein HPB51_016055 [Rhipicephalus microplus]|uniref:Uncharacterized protein n=1 Tax=Rhipicephalus microplus TaxID=6941 RepID=A0A9J6DI69_RHIMP|nr:hypothetical protein HPB51_016055 [Rhipicephalus microplus]
MADRLREINQLKIRGRIHPFNAYVADPEDVLRGIVHGLPPGTTQADLMANLRIRTQGVKIERARMLGSSKSAIITFTGDVLPSSDREEATLQTRQTSRSSSRSRSRSSSKTPQQRNISKPAEAPGKPNLKKTPSSSWETSSAHASKEEAVAATTGLSTQDVQNNQPNKGDYRSGAAAAATSVPPGQKLVLLSSRLELSHQLHQRSSAVARKMMMMNATGAALLPPSYAATLQSAQAWQPQFDPPLPPFRTSRLESWFEEFAAALYHNGIWIQELMYAVLEYHLPHDLKHHLTYFSWSPRPYDHLRDAVLKFYGLKHAPLPKNDTTAPGSSASRTPLAPQPVQTIPLPATGHIDSTPAAAPCPVAFAAETWSAERSVPGDSTTSAGPADLPAGSPPVPAPVEARDTTHTMDPEPTVTLHAISFPCTPVPAAQNLVDCQPLLT